MLLHHFVPLMGILKKQVVLAGKCMLKYVSQALFGLSPLSQNKATVLEKGILQVFISLTEII